jgi:hypothetical protein
MWKNYSNLSAINVLEIPCCGKAVEKLFLFTRKYLYLAKIFSVRRVFHKVPSSLPQQ